jgi:hypothetical protein
MFFLGCRSLDSSSSVEVADTPSTAIKRQNADTCWLFAGTAWVESMLKRQTDKDESFAEPYLLYWYLSNRLHLPEPTRTLAGDPGKFEGAGNWSEFTRLVLDHGLLRRANLKVNPSIAGDDTEYIANALSSINEQLQPGGALSTAKLRTSENITHWLDQSFGIKMADLEAKAIKASELRIDTTAAGKPLFLADLLSDTSPFRWVTTNYPKQFINSQGNLTNLSIEAQATRDKLLKQVMSLLNQRKPVVVTFWVDTNAFQNATQTFSLTKFKNGGGMQGKVFGTHNVILLDYTVDDVPGIGSIGEGKVDSQLQEAALNHFVAKNSWGSNRISSDIGQITDGKIRINADYLNAVDPNLGETTVLVDFSLPLN